MPVTTPESDPNLPAPDAGSGFQPIEFDVDGAMAAGARPKQIADFLATKTGFDVNGARKAGAKDLDIVNFLTKPVAPQSDSGNFSRGAQTAFGQNVPLAEGSIGLVGATAENMLGAGGISTAVKNWGLHGYQDGMKKLDPLSRPTDDLRVAWDKAKSGDLGALVDYGEFWLGYSGAQLGQSVLTAAAGAVLGGATAGPVGALAGAGTGAVEGGAVRAVAQTLIGKMVAKQAAEIVEQQAAKTGVQLSAESAAEMAASDAVRQQAVKAVAKNIGQGTALGAYEMNQELGTTYGAAEDQATADGRTLDTGDLARVWGAGMAAGALGGASDHLKLEALQGHIALPGVGGRVARGITGAITGATGEALEEGAQTALERIGGGQSLTSDDAKGDFLNSMMAGAIGGAPVGGIAGALHAHPHPASAPSIAAITSAPDASTAAQAAQDFIDAGSHLEDAVDSYHGIRAQSATVQGAAQAAQTQADQLAAGVAPGAGALNGGASAEPGAGSTVNTAAPAAPTATDGPASAIAQQFGGMDQMRSAVDRSATLTAQANAAPTQFDRQNADAQRQVADQQSGLVPQAAPRDSAGYVDLTPMTAKQAVQRLAVLRNGEMGPSTLAIVRHPSAPLSFAIKDMRPADQLAPAPLAQAAPADAQARLDAAAQQGQLTPGQTDMMRAAALRDRGQVVASQLGPIAGDQEAFRAASEAVAQNNGTATPAQAAVLDRLSPNERLYDRVEGAPGDAPKTATRGTVLPSAQAEATRGAVNEAVGRRRGIGGQVQGSDKPLVVPDMPRARATRVDSTQAARDTVREEKNNERMTQQEREAQARAEAPTAEAAAPSGPPLTSSVIAALKVVPALRTSEQKAVVDKARSTYSAQHFVLLQRAATQPFSLTATDKTTLGRINGERRSEARDPEGLNAFHKTLGQQIRAQVETDQLLARNHTWDHEVGDTLYSKQTGKTYEIKGRGMQKAFGSKSSEGKREAVYYYESGTPNEEGWQKGTFREAKMRETNSLINLTRPFTQNSEQRGAASEDTPARGAAGKSRISPPMAKVVEQAARLFGLKVSYFDEAGGPDGYMRKGESTIYLNRQSSVPHLAVVGHEAMHVLREEHPEAYEALLESMQGELTDENREAFAKYYGGDAQDMDEEMLADLAGNRWMEPGFLSGVFARIQEENPTRAQLIVDTLVKALTRAIDAVLHVLGSAKGFATDKLVSDLEGARASLETAFVEFGRNAKDTEHHSASQARDETGKFSTKRADEMNPDVVAALGKNIRNLTPAERVKLRVATAQKLVSTLESMPSADEMAAVAYAGRAKRGWYAGSAAALDHVFGPDAPRFAALLAAMSPQTSVESNLSNALHTWKNWIAAGRPTDRSEIMSIMGRSVQGSGGEGSVLYAWVPNAIRALTSEDPSKVTISGPKVNSFMLNLRGHTEEVTNDAWMANYALVDQKIFAGKLSAGGTDPGKGTGYLAMSARVREAAKRISKLTGEEWTPAEVQETVWSWAKTLYEAADSRDESRSAVDLVNDRAITHELINSTPDFGSLFRASEYQRPLAAAGYAERVESLRSRSDTGSASDQVARAEGQAAPFAEATQLRHERRAAARLDELKRRGKANLNTSDEEAAFSPARQSDFTKEALPDLLHKTDWAVLTAEDPGAKKVSARQNGQRMAELRRDLQADGAQFQKAIGKYGDVQNALIVTGISEDKALALGKKYGQESILTRKGLQYMDGRPDTKATGVETFDKAPDDFYTEIPGTGAYFTVNLDFAEEPAEELQSPARDQGYGTATPGSTRLYGIHYSREERARLNSSATGTAAMGAERERGAGARVNFYVDNGKGVRPEEGVGGHAHGTYLNNLYDADADNGALAANNRGNDLDAAVRKAGYDGYFTRNSRTDQGHAVLLGDHSVPVDYLGRARTQHAPEAAPAPVKVRAGARGVIDELKASKALPQGAVRGSQWEGYIKRLEPALYERMAPSGVFDDIAQEGPMYKDEVASHFKALSAETYSPERAAEPEAVDTAQSTARVYGNLTAAQEAALSRVGAIVPALTVKQRFEQFRKGLGARTQQAMFDQFAPLKKLDPLAYLQARLSKAGDGTLEAMMLYGKPFLDDGVPDVKISDKGFAKTLASLKGEDRRFLFWVAAQRAEHLKTMGLENLMTPADIATLKTLNQGNFADGSARGLVYAQALKELTDMNDAVLKIAHESGLVDDKGLAMFAGSPYVPFYRVMEDMQTAGGQRFSAGLVNQTAWKKLKGGTSMLREDLLVNVLQNWSHLITASARNRAAQAAMIAGVQQGVATAVPGAGKKAVRVMEGGKAQYYQIDDPAVLSALTSLEYVMPSWLKPLSAFKRWLTVGVTSNPAFKVRNLIRDSLTSIAQSDELGMNVLKNVAEGWKHSNPHDQLYASMMASGGIIRFGSTIEGDSAHRARALIVHAGGEILDETKGKALMRKMSDAIHAYQEFGDKSENANRVALYKQLRAKGVSHAEASFQSRDLLDFSMSGAAPLVRGLIQLVPFFNARLQGLYRLGVGATSGDKNALGLNKRFTAVTTMVALGSLALYLKYKDDDDFKKREQWDRDTYWWFKIGDKAFRIPKPFEVGSIGTMAERTFELMMGDGKFSKRAAVWENSLSQMLFQTFAFDPTPQVLKPIVDVYANKNSFTQRPIESDAMQKLLPADRYDENTSTLSRALSALNLPNPADLAHGQWTSLSPVQADYLTRAYFGWLGGLISTTADAAMRPLTGQGQRPDYQIKDLTGSMFANLPDNGSQYVTTFYNQVKAIDEAWASYEAAIKQGNGAEAREILADHEAEIAAHQGADHIKQALSKINAQMKTVMSSTAMSGADKRATLNQLAQARSKLAESGVALTP